MKVQNLPLQTPHIICYQYLAYPLSIIAHDERTLPWLYSNYIQLCCFERFHENAHTSALPLNFFVYDFARNPWLTTQCIERETFLKSGINIIQFLKDSLDSGYAGAMNVNEFFIPNRASFQKQPFSHDILVHGYDEKDGCLKVLGYKEDDHFGSTTVSFDYFEQAFRGLDDVEHGNCEQIYLYKFNEKGKFTFDASVVLESLKEYVNSTNSAFKYRMLRDPDDHIYGMDTYQALKQNINGIVTKNAHFDIRPVHVLYEHKNLMLLRLEYFRELHLIKDNSLIEDYKFVVHLIQVIRNLMIKYWMSKHDSIIENVISKITELEHVEREVLSRVINQLEAEINTSSERNAVYLRGGIQ